MSCSRNLSLRDERPSPFSLGDSCHVVLKDSPLSMKSAPKSALAPNPVSPLPISRTRSLLFPNPSGNGAITDKSREIWGWIPLLKLACLYWGTSFEAQAWKVSCSV